MKLNKLYHCDCMELMKEMPDKYIDWAIVDPPYGLGYDAQAHKKSGHQYGNEKAQRTFYPDTEWDNNTPNQEYFDELFRVSKNQIIWGGNYYADKLPVTKSWIVWDKRCDESQSNSFGDCELAWASQGVARVFRYLWKGMLQENMKTKEIRFHPTQKPVALYEWCLTHYAKEGDLILDTHCGSASSLVACHRLGFDYIGCEIDKHYFDLASERLDDEKRQMRLF